jgi:large subunit ribosomal protein L15
MATRLRKSRRQRGTRYCGWGQIGQHRQSGSRGGVGQAGKHKHFWIRTVIEEPDHFGHPQSKSHHKINVKKWANLRDLDLLYFTHIKNESTENQTLDLTTLGINKLLGGGRVTTKMTVKVEQISRHAVEKIKAIGGNVISNEHSSE